MRLSGFDKLNSTFWELQHEIALLSENVQKIQNQNGTTSEVVKQLQQALSKLPSSLKPNITENDQGSAKENAPAEKQDTPIEISEDILNSELTEDAIYTPAPRTDPYLSERLNLCQKNNQSYQHSCQEMARLLGQMAANEGTSDYQNKIDLYQRKIRNA